MTVSPPTGQSQCWPGGRVGLICVTETPESAGETADSAYPVFHFSHTKAILTVHLVSKYGQALLDRSVVADIYISQLQLTTFELTS